MKKVIIIIGVIIVLAGGIYGIIRYQKVKQSEAMLAELQTQEAQIGTLVSTTGATGIVRSNQSAMLTWQTSGTVEKVNFHVGDRVKQGDLLASLAKTSLPQNVILAQADLVSAQKALDDLLNSKLQQAQALQAVESIQRSLDDLLNSDLQQAQALKAIADAEKSVEFFETRLRNVQSTASQADIDAAEAQVVLAKDALDRAQKAFEPYANKPENNITRANLQSKLASAQQQYDFAVRNYNSLLSTGTQIDIAVAQADLATAKAQLEEAKRNYERVKDGPNPADVALLEAQLEDAKRDYDRIKDGPDPDDIAVAEARVAAAKATASQASITAPFDGVLTMVEVMPGDQVNPGMFAFRIDDISKLLVDVEVSEVDINQVKVGQDVVMTFDAILAKEYHGKVTEVSPVGNKTQGVVSFKVTLELLDADKDIKPGMTSAVNIVINQLEETLLIPNRAVRVVDGARAVYVLKNDGSIQKVNITLGASSDTLSQVIDGDLKAGDKIILNPPSTFMNGNFRHPGSMGP